MNCWRRWIGACSWSLVLALMGCADLTSVPVADHAVIDPPRLSAASDKIEVIGFYWFGCPHCADMHPRLKAWVAQRSADMVLIHRPVVFQDSWEFGARLHYALESMGELERHAGAVFEAVQINDLKLDDEPMLFDWVGRQGINRSRFIAAYRSPQVQAAVNQARHFGHDYQLRGVPSFVVAGKYLTSNGFTGSPQATLEVLARLIQQARDERSAPR